MSEREGWAEVYHGPQVQAETLAAILQAAGLTAEVLIDSFAGLPYVGAETAGLFTPEHEAARARDLLAEARGR
jgi:hypothetical protein